MTKSSCCLLVVGGTLAYSVCRTCWDDLSTAAGWMLSVVWLKLLCILYSPLSIVLEKHLDSVSRRILKAVELFLGINCWTKVIVADQSVTWRHMTQKSSFTGNAISSQSKRCRYHLTELWLLQTSCRHKTPRKYWNLHLEPKRTDTVAQTPHNV